VIQLAVDPSNPERVVLTSTVTLYLEKVALAALSDEVEKAIRAQAVADLRKNPEVRRKIAGAAEARLLSLLGMGDDQGRG
jgi:hypothetical protein